MWIALYTIRAITRADRKMIPRPTSPLRQVAAVMAELARRGLAGSCAVDLGIVRGLAYYTGTVFELHETTGRERAMAGGGRYDGLVELFGGPPTPAVGFAMGDVVMRLVLERHLEAAATSARDPRRRDLATNRQRR